MIGRRRLGEGFYLPGQMAGRNSADKRGQIAQRVRKLLQTRQ